ncbi:MAG: aspartate/tyrosine/aromatic aminotransferase [bacterium]|nr:aspartate/tyrosine/aromatic aminotransferase [bacterium]
MSNSSFFESIKMAPADPILGLTEAFNADTNPKKVNLGVGVYQNGAGKVPVLDTVRIAEARWYEKEDSKSYLPIPGIAQYNKAVQELLFGKDSPVISSGKGTTVQSLGGTGALKIGADFLRKFYPSSDIYISDPSWANHRQLFEAAGFTVKTYPYFDKATMGLDFDGMYNSIKELPPQSIVLLHACCHNPTGVDPDQEQWLKIRELFKESGLIPFFDFAYQGFGEGIDEDAFAIRSFAEAGIPCLVASSFSKSLSIYRERVGALTVITGNADEASRVLSQLKIIIRTNYSNPSSHGAQAAYIVLSDPELSKKWHDEVAEMRKRIQDMRKFFVTCLKENGITQDFSFIMEQKGMFSFSGLSKEMVQRLKDEYGIYIVGSGRICVAAMNENNIPYICEGIAKVI